MLTTALSTTAAAAIPVATAAPAAADSWPLPTFPTPLCAGPNCPPIQPRRIHRVGVDTQYAATPSVVLLPDGRLRLVYLNAPDHFGYGQSSLMTSVSADSGVTWSPATPISVPDPARDPCLSYAAGAVWLTYFRASSAQAPAEGVHARRSLDGGQTFGPAVRVDPGLPYAGCSAPIVEHGGALWLVYYGRESTATGGLELYDSTYVATSTDGGETWTSRRIAHGQADGRGYAEPWLVAAGPGSLIVMHRYGAWSQIGVTRTFDGGATWSRPAAVFTGTGRAATVRLADGTLLCLYRHPDTRDAVYALSADDGRTWPWRRQAMRDYANSQFGMVYGHPLELSPGQVYFPLAMEDSASRCVLWQGVFR